MKQIVINTKTQESMYQNFRRLYTDIAQLCDGYVGFNWDDSLRRIIIRLVGSKTQILWTVRMDENGEWTQYSALLIPPRPEESEEEQT